MLRELVCKVTFHSLHFIHFTKEETEDGVAEFVINKCPCGEWHRKVKIQPWMKMRL